MKQLLILLLAAALILGALCARPPLLGAEDLSAEMTEAIRGQAQGVYSSRLPLIPLWVTVQSRDAQRVEYTIHYFPFGTVGMSYTVADGYNIEKPLTGLS